MCNFSSSQNPPVVYQSDPQICKALSLPPRALLNPFTEPDAQLPKQLIFLLKKISVGPLSKFSSPLSLALEPTGPHGHVLFATGVA